LNAIAPWTLPNVAANAAQVQTPAQRRRRRPQRVEIRAEIGEGQVVLPNEKRRSLRNPRRAIVAAFASLSAPRTIRCLRRTSRIWVANGETCPRRLYRRSRDKRSAKWIRCSLNFRQAHRVAWLTVIEATVANPVAPVYQRASDSLVGPRPSGGHASRQFETGGEGVGITWEHELTRRRAIAPRR
jgi:hypothetical protein